ncbi:MAG: hypothetical protein JXA89_25495 [Anaerolineae bacterium]|nr:hypothetical protein [Anaerolineae bacterium]
MRILGALGVLAAKKRANREGAKNAKAAQRKPKPDDHSLFTWHLGGKEKANCEGRVNECEVRNGH